MPIVSQDTKNEKDQIVGVVVLVLILVGLTWIVLRAARKKRK